MKADRRPRVSVIVAAYNQGRHLEQCLRSLLSQSMPRDEYEIIVVNDGSTDDTPAVMAKYQSEVSGVHHQSNRGLAEACNTGLDHAQGEYVIRVDSDDWVTETDKHAKQIAFNAVPHIDDFLDNRYTKEEMKLVWETRKIFADDDILVNATAVRVPTFFGHSAAIHIETATKITAEEVCKLMVEAPGVELIDGVTTGQYPTAVTDSSGNDAVFVGRVREDISHPSGINLWVVSDNIRKGAALNSVQIAEILAKNYL